MIEQVNIPFYQQFVEDGEIHANEVMEQAVVAMLDQLVKLEALLRPLREEAARERLSARSSPGRASPATPVNALPAGEQERDHVGDLGRLDQLLDRVRREDHLLDHVVLGEVVRLGLVGDLLLDERRADVAGAYRGGGDSVAGALERERLTRPSTPCLAET